MRKRDLEVGGLYSTLGVDAPNWRSAVEVENARPVEVLSLDVEPQFGRPHVLIRDENGFEKTTSVSQIKCPWEEFAQAREAARDRRASTASRLPEFEAYLNKIAAAGGWPATISLGLDDRRARPHGLSLPGALLRDIVADLTERAVQFGAVDPADGVTGAKPKTINPKRKLAINREYVTRSVESWDYLDIDTMHQVEKVWITDRTDEPHVYQGWIPGGGGGNLLFRSDKLVGRYDDLKEYVTARTWEGTTGLGTRERLVRILTESPEKTTRHTAKVTSWGDVELMADAVAALWAEHDRLCQLQAAAALAGSSALDDVLG